MSDVRNVYYVNEGKYESNAKSLQSLLPKQGVSTDKYLACFGTMVRIYADAYNNGWGGNSDMFNRLFLLHVRPVMGARFGDFRKFYKDTTYLEESINKVITHLIKDDNAKFERIAFIKKGNSTMFIKDTYDFGRCVFKSYSAMREGAKRHGLTLETV